MEFSTIFIFNISLTLFICENVVVLFIYLICRGTDISKYFSVSLGLRDNESRLYTKCIPRTNIAITSQNNVYPHMPQYYIAKTEDVGSILPADFQNYANFKLFEIYLFSFSDLFYSTNLSFCFITKLLLISYISC